MSTRTSSFPSALLSTDSQIYPLLHPTFQEWQRALSWIEQSVLIGLGAACSKYTVFFFLDHYTPNIDRTRSQSLLPSSSPFPWCATASHGATSVHAQHARHAGPSSNTVFGGQVTLASHPRWPHDTRRRRTTAPFLRTNPPRDLLLCNFRSPPLRCRRILRRTSGAPLALEVTQEVTER